MLNPEITEVVKRNAEVNMKYLLLNLVVILSIIQSGKSKSTFLISMRNERIVRRYRTLYGYELTKFYALSHTVYVTIMICVLHP